MMCISVRLVEPAIGAPARVLYPNGDTRGLRLARAFVVSSRRMMLTSTRPTLELVAPLTARGGRVALEIARMGPVELGLELRERSRLERPRHAQHERRF